MAGPSVYLFYGDDPLSLRDAVASLRDRLGDAAEFNLQRFDAPNLDLVQLQQACQALPFLSDRRLIIVEDAQRLPARGDFVHALHALLEGLPSSTALVFVARLDHRERSAEQQFQQRSPVYAWARAHPDASFVRRYAQPSGAALTRWLIERAAEHGLELEHRAAELLSELVDQDLRLAEQELLKLSNYAEEGGRLTQAEVERLTPIYGQTEIFEVVDGLAGGGQSLGPKGTSLPLSKLHRLLQEQDPAYVFLMVVRQFRLLLRARHALDQSDDPVEHLDVPGFVARKIAAQAAHLKTHALESFYRQLVDLEVAVKRGQADLSLDLIPLLTSLSASPS